MKKTSTLKKTQIPTAWNLSEIYSGMDDPKIQKDIDKVLGMSETFFKTHAGHLKTYNPGKLKKTLSEYESLVSLAYRLDLFASLSSSLDTLDGGIAAFSQKITLILTESDNKTLFLFLELAKHPKLKDLASGKAMGQYGIIFQNLLKQKKHHLDNPREQLLNTKSVTANIGWYEMLEKICTKIQIEIPSGKKTQKISLEEGLNALRSSDYRKRQSAGIAVSKALRENEEIFTHTYSMILTDKLQNDRLRGFQNPEDARHFANRLEPAAVSAMQSVVDENIDLVSRYYRVKSKFLGLKRLNEHDRYAPLVSGVVEGRYDFADGVATVEKAFREFDPEFAELFLGIVKTAHIDAYPNSKKRGGAFCAFWEDKPYVFLNYFGKSRDVQVLAHESGHGIHSILASDLPLLVRNAPLAMAETASIFGEMLVFEKVFAAAKSSKEKIMLLSSKIEEDFSIIFRQMAMYRFEQLAHQAIKKQGHISAKELQVFWLETQRAMYGNSVEISDEYKYWWQYVAHFYHTPFYVYSYSFGGLLVLSLFEEYKRDRNSFVPKYKKFLALGGSKTPQEALTEFGFNLSDPNFWRLGIVALREMIIQLESLV